MGSLVRDSGTGGRQETRHPRGMWGHGGGYGCRGGRGRGHEKAFERRFLLLDMRDDYSVRTWDGDE